MDAIYVDAESHGYYGDDEPPESVVLVGEGGSIEYVHAGEYHWLRDFLNGIAPKCGTKDCSSLVEYVRQLEVEADELRGLVMDLWRFTGTACKKYPRLFDQSAQGGQMVQLNAIDAFEQRMRELGVDE